MKFIFDCKFIYLQFIYLQFIYLYICIFLDVAEFVGLSVLVVYGTPSFLRI